MYDRPPTLPVGPLYGGYMVPVYSGTDVVGVLEVTTALAIQLCKFKWVPSRQNRVVRRNFFRGGDA